MSLHSLTELDTFLEKKVRELKISGASVVIRGREGVVFNRGYGVRDLARSVTPDGDTIYGIASMGKSMAGLSLALLAVEGKLSLEDPVCKYVPKFRIAGNADDAVTIRSLLTHTAGIPPMEPLEWSIAVNTPTRESDWARQLRATAPNPMNTMDQIVDYIANCGYPTLGAPGEYMSYSNEGYAVACAVAEAASGMPMEQFLEERVFRPMGMTRSILDEDASGARKLAAEGNITALFEVENGEFVGDEDWSILPPFKACACVKSTASDMARYYHCLANGGVIDGVRAIPEAAVELMIGKAFPEQEKAVYCLGLNKRVVDGHVICEHTGGLHGVSSAGGMIRDLGWGAAVLTNTGDADPDDLIWAVYDFLLDKPLDTPLRWLHPAGTAFRQPEMLVGRYICREGIPAVAEIVWKDGKLKALRDGDELDMVFCGETWFLLYRGDAVAGRMRFHIRDGKAWGVQVYTRVYQREEEA